jgi:hypothetical protein
VKNLQKKAKSIFFFSFGNCWYVIGRVFSVGKSCQHAEIWNEERLHDSFSGQSNEQMQMWSVEPKLGNERCLVLQSNNDNNRMRNEEEEGGNNKKTL